MGVILLVRGRILQVTQGQPEGWDTKDPGQLAGKPMIWPRSACGSLKSPALAESTVADMQATCFGLWHMDTKMELL